MEIEDRITNTVWAWLWQPPGLEGIEYMAQVVAVRLCKPAVPLDLPANDERYLEVGPQAA